MPTNLDYIKQVHVGDIPWNLLSTPYDRAGLFPEWFKEITNEDDARATAAAEEIALNIEHQNTLWQVSPFAMIILDRLLSSAIDKFGYTRDEADKTVIRLILEIYVPVFETIAFMKDSGIEHAAPLPHFRDMLAPEHLLPPPETLEVEDEDKLDAYLETQYLEMPDNLFFSFFYYSWQVLAFSLNKNSYKLIEIKDLAINRLLDKMNDQTSRAYLDQLMYT